MKYKILSTKTGKRGLFVSKLSACQQIRHIIIFQLIDFYCIFANEMENEHIQMLD